MCKNGLSRECWGRETDIYILDDIHFTNILAQRTNTDSVTPTADKVLDNDIRAVRLKRDAVISVINTRVLYHNI